MNGGLVVEARCTGVRRLRPPHVELRLAVRLTNGAGGPRWALLPDDVTGGTAAGARVAAIELQPAGSDRTPVVHGTGPAGFFGVLIAAGADISLHDVPVAGWGELPERTELTVTSASALRVAGTDVATRFGLEPLATVSVDASSLADQRGVCDVVEAAVGALLDLHLDDPRTTAVAIRLPQ